MGQGEEAHRLISFTQAALDDLAGIDHATAVTWGVAQAERYLNFLSAEIKSLAESPDLGRIVEQRPHLRVYTAKLRKRRAAHGHRIIYQVVGDGILVVRVLHTAMLWPESL